TIHLREPISGDYILAGIHLAGTISLWESICEIPFAGTHLPELFWRDNFARKYFVKGHSAMDMYSIVHMFPAPGS
uniref:hypothetical protein n=1 Tax=Hungatella effluvii TaxID=1096246 RepID=UPI002A80A59D